MTYLFENRNNFTFITHYRNGRSWASMVGIVIGYGLDNRGVGARVLVRSRFLSSQAPNPNNYGRALLIAPPQAIASNPHTNLLNVYIQLANKNGVSAKQILSRPFWVLPSVLSIAKWGLFTLKAFQQPDMCSDDRSAMYCYKRVLALIFVQPQLSNEYVIL
jgi:hypothetical protein